MKKVFFCVAFFLLLAPHRSAAQYIPPDRFNDAYKTSIGFWPNDGQVINTNGQLAPSVKFYSNGSVPKVYLHDKNQTSFVVRSSDVSGSDTLRRIDMEPVGVGVVEVDPIAVDLKDMTHRYYLSHCPDGIEVPGYNRIIYENVYEKIDFHYYGASAGQKFAMVCRPGSDPEQIRLRFTGQDSLGLDLNGFLQVYYDGGYIRLPYAVAYQVNALGTIVPLTWGATYEPDNNSGTVSFFIDEYEPSLPLVLLIGSLPLGGGTEEPQPTWSTLVGRGSSTGISEFITAGDADASGNLYVAGNTRDEAFPANTGLTVHQGNNDIMFGRFRYAPGTVNDARLDYMTFFGGEANDKPTVLHVTQIEDTEYLYIGGWTNSSPIPMIPDANPNNGSYYQSALKGPTDGLVIKAIASDGAIQTSTYFGGEGNEMITGVTEDNANALYFVGATTSTSGSVAANCTSPVTGFPLCDSQPNAYVSSTNAGGTDGFIMKLDTEFNLTWSTFFGGTGEDLVFDAAYLLLSSTSQGPTDRIAIVGSSSGSLPFTTTTGYHIGTNAEETGFIFTFGSDGMRNWGTFLPGVVRLEGVVDDKTDFMVMGMTKFQAATDFTCSPEPGVLSICTPSGSYQDASINRHDAYFGQFSQPNGTLIWSTAYGDLGWLGARFPDENTGPDYFKEKQIQPFPIFRFSDLERDGESNIYAMGLYQHGYWEIDDDQSTIPGFGLYNQPWDPLTGSNQTDLTLFLFSRTRELLWASLFGAEFDHVESNEGIPYDLQWYMKGCDFGQDLVLLPDEALYWVGTSGGVVLPQACPNVGTSWCEESLTDVGDDLDLMQGFITRMDIRNVSIGLPEPSSSSAHDLIIVPNPGNDRVGFIVDGVNSNFAPFTITNALGQVVLAGRADHNGTVDIRGLASGCYAVTLLDKSGVRMRTAQFVRQ